MKALITVAASAVIISGCASALRGTTEPVTITTEPAGAAIRTSLGHTCPASPCTFQVSRKADFTAFADKPGYHPNSVFIGTKPSNIGRAAVASNMMATGFVGTAIDSSTGAALDHHPNPAHIILAPEASQPPAVSPAMVPAF
ncbi:translation initiation factor 2 [Tianweitania sp. BSSL-BM11]|uniref:Translation initiation factor 2 n=1 Tax=Tianweitania aestuarii TaxID=2814886 RepID=A0ABS5RXZ4_9HYPH|nr:translation initiation factor 2 [Tianweitania aestuarii]MBS9721202.1 translation initiation factor 2 [Tianweitania aestuarii]